MGGHEDVRYGVRFSRHRPWDLDRWAVVILGRPVNDVERAVLESEPVWVQFRSLLLKAYKGGEWRGLVFRFGDRGSCLSASELRRRRRFCTRHGDDT